MPELNPLRIAVEAEDDTTFEYQAGVYVTKEGEFHVDLDERLCEIADKIPKHEHHVTVAYVPRTQRYKVHGKVLGHIANFIRACAEDYLACETKTSRVIIYGHRIEVSIWVGKDGKLYPNGAVEGADGGAWFKGSDIHSSNRVSFYSVGLCAAVYDKTVFKRKSGDTVKWEFVRDSKDEAIEQLNSFCALSINPEREQYKEMPYTPQAADFFARMMLSLCRLALQMDEFFGSKERLALAIQEGARLLPAPEDGHNANGHNWRNPEDASDVS